MKRSQLYIALAVGLGLTEILVAVVQIAIGQNQNSAQSQSQSQSQSISNLTAGKKTYDANCVGCHGENGEGKGKAAPFLYPKPRDFTRGLFKVRTTPNGTLPTDNDLLDTLNRGMPGSAMPRFSWLNERDKKAVVEYLKSFYVESQKKVLETEDVVWEAGLELVVGKEPGITPETLADGKKWYQELECFKCHGELGKGDGPSAEDQKDDWGYPIKVRDFTSGIYKGGPADKDLYLRFTTGMSGTPMPAYEADIITDEERWHLVHYVQSLRRQDFKPVIPPKDGIIISHNLITKIPFDDPNSPLWDKAQAYEIPLMNLWQREREIDRVRVKSIHNQNEIAFLLEWSDPMADKTAVRVDDFRDAAAIQFPLSPNQTFVGMGHVNEAVNIWHWKADWQADMEQFQDVDTVYKNLHSDVITDKLFEESDTFLSGRAAKNPLSAARHASPIEDLNAIGLGTLTSQSPELQNVRGKGIWQEGKWRVVFVRSLQSNQEHDAQFAPGKSSSIAFAIWNGNEKDRDGQKAVSTWYQLQIAK